MTDMATRMGVRSTLRDNDLTQVLGTSSVTALDMASAMATFANDGVACPARLILSVTGPDGSKFLQEATFFAEAEATATRLGWKRAARAARAHVSSRLNALSELPGALRMRNADGRRNLTRHVLGLRRP